MYSRSSKYRNMSIPENYSGNAFGGRAGSGFFQDEDLPELKSASWESARGLSEDLKETVPSEALPSESLYAQENPAEATSKKTETPTSLFPSLLSENFPFGHGIGTEELIIIGIMLIILRSPDEKRDSDMILILALLLFAA